MSATEPSNSPAPSGQGEISSNFHDEGHQLEQQVTSTNSEPARKSENDALADPKDTKELNQGDMEADMQNTPQGAVTGSLHSVPTPVADPPSAIPTQPESLPGRMKGLTISTNTLDRSPSPNTDQPPPPPEKDDAYLNQKPQPAPTSHSSTKTSSEWTEKELPEVPERGKKADNDGVGRDDVSQPEIQSIMEQFQDPTHGDSEELIMSPRLELAEQFFGGQGHFPPRQSSLDQRKAVGEGAQASDVKVGAPSASPEKQHASSSTSMHRRSLVEEPALTRRSSTSTLPPPPEPEPDQPFDFHRFLEQLRHRTADPVAKFLRSFLHEFGKRQWMVHEQVKIISDFLAFITNKMAICEVWRDVSDGEFDNAKEGMEKLVMNRLYSQTFSPAIPSPPTIPRSTSRSKRREMERLHGPWRRGQHQEDIERDEVLAQKIRIYSWVREAHLDIPPVGSHGRRFLTLAQQELSKINSYRAPRDKVICILNCCKVIFGLLKNSKSSDTSADSFVPLLIYVVLHANPEHLVSNIQYILRFRNQDKLGGEAGYYLSSLSGAIQFIETLDRTSLTVSDEDFERNVEAAVSAIAQQNRESESLEPKSTQRSQSTPRSSVDVPRGRREATQSNDEDNAPVAGLLRTIQKPLSTIGRIFSDEPDSQEERRTPPATSSPVSPSPRLNPNVYQPPRNSGEERRSGERSRNVSQPRRARTHDAQDAAVRQASAEDAEARRIQRVEHNNMVETLSNMFPNLDRDVIDDVVKMKEGRVGLAVDACLALSAE
ncbi:guanine nucleotide exchange factor Vps9 [Aspergillus pseudonomiae]|uniref:Guanine nucleotide exchange factor Vps9 n=1 Tax=Aspergillus pseudonomiae TaxID=1506151 RepID=A0A5N7CYJ1_9EURO|nr:guanine nucleotide exchange factor Vps9 [Aspergillus pseudonomiae]KAE8398633.1 guanine nucleotide exchange factor Vps9 [Aspergillus pseudonomiae]